MTVTRRLRMFPDSVSSVGSIELIHFYRKTQLVNNLLRVPFVGSNESLTGGMCIENVEGVGIHCCA